MNNRRPSSSSSGSGRGKSGGNSGGQSRSNASSKGSPNSGGRSGGRKPVSGKPGAAKRVSGGAAGKSATGKPAYGKGPGQPAAGKSSRPVRKQAKADAYREADHIGVPEQFRDAERGERLHKVLAIAGIASRRDSEALIRNGQVRVNGKLITGLPAWVDPTSDRITVDGKPIQAGPTRRGEAAGRAYVMLNKPRGVVSTTSDPQGRRTVLDLVDVPNARRLYPVGRLDVDSSGLILLTNDGDLAQALTHPSYEISKTYEVSVRGHMTDDEIDRLRSGMKLTHKDDHGGRSKIKHAAVDAVKLLGFSKSREPDSERTRLSLVLHEGQNREIRRLVAGLGYKVRRLHRHKIGPLSVKGLGAGQWRLVTGAELNRLKGIVASRERAFNA